MMPRRKFWCEPCKFQRYPGECSHPSRVAFPAASRWTEYRAGAVVAPNAASLNSLHSTTGDSIRPSKFFEKLWEVIMKVLVPLVLFVVLPCCTVDEGPPVVARGDAGAAQGAADSYTEKEISVQVDAQAEQLVDAGAEKTGKYFECTPSSETDGVTIETQPCEEPDHAICLWHTPATKYPDGTMSEPSTLQVSGCHVAPGVLCVRRCNNGDGGL